MKKQLPLLYLIGIGYLYRAAALQATVKKDQPLFFTSLQHTQEEESNAQKNNNCAIISQKWITLQRN